MVNRNKVVKNVADFTEEHPVFTLLTLIIFGIPAIVFVLTLCYNLIFFQWLGM